MDGPDQLLIKEQGCEIKIINKNLKLKLKKEQNNRNNQFQNNNFMNQNIMNQNQTPFNNNFIQNVINQNNNQNNIQNDFIKNLIFPHKAGLKNLGKSSYLNSTIECLSNIKGLSKKNFTKLWKL